MPEELPDPAELATEFADQDFYDFEFSIASAERAADGAFTVRAQGEFEGEAVGFEVRLGTDWEEQHLAGINQVFYWGRLELVSIGAPSDLLLRTLDDCFETGLGDIRMAERVPFTVASLEGDPRAPESASLMLKLFYEPEDDQGDEEELDPRYAEIYLNIDLEAGMLELAEKDLDYRIPLLKCLAGVTA